MQEARQIPLPVAKAELGLFFDLRNGQALPRFLNGNAFAAGGTPSA